MALLYYHVNWPGTDPMNTDDAADASARVNYYSVGGVPQSMFDGNNVGIVNQTNINTDYAVPSPFDMKLSHTINGAKDSIFIHCRIKCTQAVSVTGPMVCQVAIVENHILFSVPPGGNGEVLFYNVMRKMLPTNQGTTLVNSWAVNDSLILSFAVPIPSYVIDKNQLAVVAFIQDNATQWVEQAAYSEPLPVPLDAAVTSFENLPAMQCSATFTPQVVLKNKGLTVLSSATIKYRIDNGTINTQAWTGSLAHGDSALVSLPMVTGATGSHTYTAIVINPNGGTDQNVFNDTISGNYVISLTNPVFAPLTEGFEGSTFPPSNWILNSPDNSYTWDRSTSAGAGGSSKSAFIDFYYIPSGINDMIITPINLTGAINAKMIFSLAHAQYSPAYIDELQILASTDCGATWNIVYDKSDPSLATVLYDSASVFVPSPTQWRTDTVNLNSYVGNSSVFINFHGITGYGNDLYIDNINISETVGINQITDPINILNIYPNPASNNLSIIVSQKSVIEISNIQGQLIKTITNAEKQTTIDVSDLSGGVYIIKAKTENGVAVKKFVKE